VAARPGAVVVGTSFGARVHVPALRAAGFDVVGLVGRDGERTARRADRMGIANPCASLDEALALPGVAAVTIATPPATHHDLAIAACTAGKAVICEKPFALGAPEAAAMVEAAAAAGVPALVGHEFRWAPERATVGRAIASSAIGEPRLATLTAHVPLVHELDAPVPGWWFDPRAGGGWLGASGSHQVDQVRTWLGEFASVSAALPMVSGRDPTTHAEDSFSIRFTLRSGVEGVLQQTAAAWGPVDATTVVAGTEGTVGIDGDGPWIADRHGRRALPVPDDLALPAAAPSDDAAHRFSHLELGPYTRLCEALRALVDGREPPTAVPVPTFADGLAHMLVLDAARASASTHGAPAPVHLVSGT
jgi:predicted dehydrogenase